MNRWYGTDELRQSWYLLTIDTDSIAAGRFITSCEIGAGNQEQLIETEKLTADNPSEEAELLQELGTWLDDGRYNDITLITASTDTLAVVRTRFLACDQIQQPTLRGFRHIAIVELLSNYFVDKPLDQLPDLTNKHTNSSERVSPESPSFEEGSSSVTELWKTRSVIGPLVPPDALQGTPL